MMAVSKATTYSVQVSYPFYRACFVFLLVLSALRGVRSPNHWGYTHYLYNYEYGFVKRGFLGALVQSSGLDFLQSYAFFCAFSFAIYAAGLWLLGRWVLRLARQDGVVALASLVFCSSVSLAYLSHTVGYADQIGLLVTLLILTTAPYPRRLFYAWLGCVFCLLIHEAYFFVFFPVVFVSLLLDATTTRRVVMVLLLALGMLLLTFALSHALMDRQDVFRAFTDMQARTDVTLRLDALMVLTYGAATNVSIVRHYWAWENLWPCLLVTVPSCLVFIVAALRYYAGPWRIIRLPLVVGASFAPMALILIGTDVERFGALCILTSFLVYLTVRQQHARSGAARPLWRSQLLHAAVWMLVALNLTSDIRLMDSRYMHHFPYYTAAGTPTQHIENEKP